MRKEIDLDETIHFIMCMVGGFIGSYAILLRGNFGSAQTANLIQLIIAGFHKNLIDFAMRILAFVIYASCIIIAYIQKKHKKQTKMLCIIIEVVGVILIGFIPENIPHLVALLPVFAITAYQWGNFNGTKKYSSPTLFSTGNIRQCIESWTEFMMEKDVITWNKAIFYTETLCSYHFGVAVGVLFVFTWHIKSIWFLLIPLLIVLILLKRNDQHIYHKT